MAEKLTKFVSRAPRYVLRPQDRNVMRFSLEHTLGNGGITHTILLNLSETGVAFLMDPGTEPAIGERIKVEIPIPGDQQIAWWAKVVRIEEYVHSHWSLTKDPFQDQEKILVGLRFESLPEPHTRAIRRGIELSFIRAAREQRFRTWAYYRAIGLRNALTVMLYFLLAAAAVGFIYYFTLPDAKYDAKRGAPWGDRFKFF